MPRLQDVPAQTHQPIATQAIMLTVRSGNMPVVSSSACTGPWFSRSSEMVLCHSTQQQDNQHERCDEASAESQQAHRSALDHVHPKPIQDLVDVEEVDTTVPGLHQGAPLHSIRWFARQGGAK